MSLTIDPPPDPLPADLLDRLRRVSFPTLGHYLEEGFVDPDLARQCGVGRVVGRAVTVRLTGQDSTLLHHAAGLCEAGDVVLVDTGGDRRHAPVGEVLAEALHARGAAGVVIDGVMTDVDEVEALGIPVYARGRSLLTTKLLHLDAGGLHVPVSIGGVAVRSGDVVLGDRNGVFVAPRERAAAVVGIALQDDAEEPGLIEELREGARLGDLTGASAAVRALAEVPA